VVVDAEVKRNKEDHSSERTEKYAQKAFDKADTVRDVPVTPPMVVPRLFEISKKAILERLDRAAQPSGKPDGTCEERYAKGALCGPSNLFAKEWAADLITVGSHDRSGFDRVVMGSVSEAVALHAKCSVEIVRERRSPE
jgi:nucleotide-binding universal stress UspA family protein